jgi:hypothetical protein
MRLDDNTTGITSRKAHLKVLQHIMLRARPAFVSRFRRILTIASSFVRLTKVRIARVKAVKFKTVKVKTVKVEIVGRDEVKMETTEVKMVKVKTKRPK